MQSSSYFNAALEQKQNINVTQVNPAPPTVKPESLLDCKNPPDTSSPFNWIWSVEAGQLSNRSDHCVFWQLVNL